MTETLWPRNAQIRSPGTFALKRNAKEAAITRFYEQLDEQE
jgi:hypothetical protein